MILESQGSITRVSKVILLGSITALGAYPEHTIRTYGSIRDNVGTIGEIVFTSRGVWNKWEANNRFSVLLAWLGVDHHRSLLITKKL
jgi:hypothetical protein